MQLAYEKCQTMIEQYNEGTLQNKPGCNAE